MYESVHCRRIDEGVFSTDQQLYLKPGAQVMLIRNDPNKQWVNGDIGKIERCSTDGLTVRIKGQRREVRPITWGKVPLHVQLATTAASLRTSWARSNSFL